jgi:molybdopterin/thiamine biosynthesis adenylyltransferase
MSTHHLTRQMDIIPLNKLDKQITVIGAGAVGGWTVLSLAKMGFGNIKVFDHDEIDVENMNCQFYPFKAIGHPKVKVLKKLVKDFANLQIEVEYGRYEGKEQFPGIVISAVDSMAVRKMIWDAHSKKSPATTHIIDPRMGAEVSLLYVMDPNNEKDIDSYGKTLYSDDDAVHERCTAKATIYTANLLAGQVCKAVKDIAVGQPYTRVSQWDIANNFVQMWNKNTEG